METYTSLSSAELQKHLPSYLNIEKEVTGVPEYSMFTLSKRDLHCAVAVTTKLHTNFVNLNGY